MDIFILTSERPKQLGTSDGEVLLIAVNLFEKSYVENFFFFLLQSTVLLLGRSKGSRLGISLWSKLSICDGNDLSICRVWILGKHLLLLCPGWAGSLSLLTPRSVKLGHTYYSSSCSYPRPYLRGSLDCGNPSSFPTDRKRLFWAWLDSPGLFVILFQKKVIKYKNCLRKSSVLFFISPEFMEELKNSRPNVQI